MLQGWIESEGSVTFPYFWSMMINDDQWWSVMINDNPWASLIIIDHHWWSMIQWWILEFKSWCLQKGSARPQDILQFDLCRSVMEPLLQVTSKKLPIEKSPTLRNFEKHVFRKRTLFRKSKWKHNMGWKMLQLQKTFTNALAAQVKAQTGRRASIYTLALKRSLPWPKAKIR